MLFLNLLNDDLIISLKLFIFKILIVCHSHVVTFLSYNREDD